MNPNEFSRPLSLKSIHLTDSFWSREAELVRTQIIPYQWDALNDRIPDAEASYCMRNFRIAGKLNERRRQEGAAFQEPKYSFRGFQALPEDKENPGEQFYGFVFQDSDFYKWIEAVAYSLAQHPDAALERQADEAIELVAAAQQEDGYLDTYYIINGKDKIFSNLRDHHELYCFGHLTEGAVAYYEATGKDRLLKVAMGFADYIAARFGAGKCMGYPGHEIAEMALFRLYAVTGDEKYRELARFFLEQRGQEPHYFENGEEHPTKADRQYTQTHLPVRRQEEAVGHAVRAVYLYSGMADMARLFRDEDMLRACDTLWNNVVNQKMYITGGIGGTHLGEAFSFNYDLPADTAYAETCASIGLVFFARRMLEIHSDSRFSDVMELALYNGILSGMALDGKSFFYVNPLEVVPEACHKDARKAHVDPVRQKWFGCACCPPNLVRLLSSIGAYAYTENEDTFFLHLYVGAELPGLKIQSEMPWSGKVKLTAAEGFDKKCIAVRLPGWADGYKTRVNMKNPYSTEIRDGYLYIFGEFVPGDEISLEFAMGIRVLEADSRIRENYGSVAVMRGPVVYCMEQADNGADLHLIHLPEGAELTARDMTVAGETGSAEVKAITASGVRRIPVQREGKLPYYPAQKPKTVPCEITLIPYYTWANRGENEMRVWIHR